MNYDARNHELKIFPSCLLVTLHSIAWLASCTDISMQLYIYCVIKFTLFSFHLIFKYLLIKSASIDFQCVNNNNSNPAQVIPIVISSTGVIPKSLSRSLTRLNLHPNTYTQLQKSVILGACSIVRNFLNYKQDHRA